MIDLETYLKAQLTKLYGGKKKNNLDDFQCLNHEQETKKCDMSMHCKDRRIPDPLAGETSHLHFKPMSFPGGHRNLPV